MHEDVSLFSILKPRQYVSMIAGRFCVLHPLMVSINLSATSTPDDLETELGISTWG